MSADAWRICPNCEQVANEAFVAKLAAARDSYGKVTPEAYAKLCAQAAKKPELEESLREDYEIGVWNGKFEVSYHGMCQRCGLTHEFKTTQVLGPPPKDFKSRTRG